MYTFEEIRAHEQVVSTAHICALGSQMVKTHNFNISPFDESRGTSIVY